MVKPVVSIPKPQWLFPYCRFDRIRKVMKVCEWYYGAWYLTPRCHPVVREAYRLALLESLTCLKDVVSRSLADGNPRLPANLDQPTSFLNNMEQFSTLLRRRKYPSKDLEQCKAHAYDLAVNMVVWCKQQRD
jgi:hypothetical protein